jgi:hypothetical protein
MFIKQIMAFSTLKRDTINFSYAIQGATILTFYNRYLLSLMFFFFAVILVGLASTKRRLILHHLVGDVVNSHRVNGDVLAGVENFTDRQTIFRFEGYLAMPVV